MREQGASRRTFLIGSLGGLSAGWLASRWPAILEAREHVHRAAQAVQAGQAPRLEFFSPEQAVEIEAVAAQIIPGDDTPGAREARVVNFIDRALTSFDRHKQPLYTQGLADLESRARKVVPDALRFSQLTSRQQIQLLTAIEKTEFFDLIRTHTVMGFLSNPEYGGNHGQAGWKLIGFEDTFSYQPPFGYYDSDHQQEP